MINTAGLNVPRIKQQVVAYWMQDPRMNGPVKVISAARAASLGAKLGAVIPVGGCVVSAKFVLGRPLAAAEKILGLNPGELSAGGALLRLTRFPSANEFDLAGYTNVPAYPGYPTGLGSNQWVVTTQIPAKVEKLVGPGGTF
jgi:hypothetical protein